jgi:hypothetical protein
MPISMLKLLQDRHIAGRTKEGYPVKGNPHKNLDPEEYENIPLELGAKVQVFDLANHDDIVKYQEVLNMVSNGLWTRLAPDREIYDEETKNWRILCRWAEIFGVVEEDPDVEQQLRYAGNY